ncbi:ABC transporter permease [Campylobacter sp. MG1]|uniref:ABC transporter permease n=1 Tax=Campylobacter sp. MG1 TaxID=2976332 RepID=UPI00226C9AAF|nr:ABC transporter permease [Campylobacter sp. MG1]
MFLRIIKKSIFGNVTQKLLSFATIFLACLLLSCMLNITMGVGNELTKELRNYGANISVVPQGSALSIEVGNKTFKPFESKNYLELKDLHKIKEIFWRNNIIAFAPFKDYKAKYQGKEIKILGTYFNKNIPIDGEDDYTTGILGLFPFWKSDMNFVDDENKEIQANIGTEFANTFGLKSGDEIDVEFESGVKKIKIVGIINNLGDYDNKLIINIDKLNEIIGDDATYERAEVSALTIPENDLAIRARHDKDSLDSVEFDKWYCTAYVSSIAYQIEEDYKGASAKAVSKVADAESSIVKKIQGLMGIIFLISLVVASVAQASLINSDVYRRSKEIGLLKALGANNLQIYLIFMVDYLCVSLVASVFGSIFGFFVSDLIALNIFSHSISYNFIIIFICMFFASLIAIFGSLLATKNFIKLEIVEVLYGRK